MGGILYFLQIPYFVKTNLYLLLTLGKQNSFWLNLNGLELLQCFFNFKLNNISIFVPKNTNQRFSFENLPFFLPDICEEDGKLSVVYV